MAAGAGTRLGGDVPKAFVALSGLPIVRWALNQALACPDVARVIIVVPPDHLADARALLTEDERARVQLVPGGADRVASVRLGLAHLTDRDGIVLVHDAARALTPPALFSDVVHAIRQGHGAVVPGVPVVDTVKQVGDDGKVTATLKRSGLRAIQTPQGFVREVLVHAHARAREHGLDVTDDASLVEASGAPVLVIPGDPLAEKITTARDLRAAEFAIASLERAGSAADLPQP